MDWKLCAYKYVFNHINGREDSMVMKQHLYRYIFI